MPKGLSEKESHSYFKGGGFFVIPNDTNQNNSLISIQKNDNEIKWQPATKQIEEEYAKFYKLLYTMDNDYLIIVKTKLVDNFMRNRK